MAAAASLGPREGDMVLATGFKRPFMGDDNGMIAKEGIGGWLKQEGPGFNITAARMGSDLGLG